MGHVVPFLKSIVENPQSRRGRIFDLSIQFLIVASIVSFSLETVPGLPDELVTALGVIEILCVAGGIRSVADAEEVLREGAEKISINSPALADPELIGRLNARFGAQCVVVGIDSQSIDGDYYVYQFTGDPQRTRNTARRTLDWVREVQEHGAGEIVLNCMASDGVRKGYDIAQLTAVRRICKVPLIASGGAGTQQHFAAVFNEARVDGALAASVFHTGVLEVPDLKRFLRTQAIEVRL
jgi:cyclase